MSLENNDNRLSSRLTFFYKWIVSSVIITFNLCLILSCLFLFPSKYWDLYLILIPFCLLASVIVLWPLLNLKDVSFNQEFLFVWNRANRIRIPLSKIVLAERFMFYFIKIKYVDNNKTVSVVVIPKVEEFIVSFGFGAIKSFKILQERVQQNKT